MTMTHPGLPEYWGYIIWAFMFILSLWALWAKSPPLSNNELNEKNQKKISLAKLPLVGFMIRFLTLSSLPLLILKVTFVSIFILLIVAGLYGTAVPERNLATVLTWNIWWAGLVVSIFFLGSAWCAVCPWDTLANWIVKPRLWLLEKGFKIKRIKLLDSSLGLTPPKIIRSVWPALLMFIILTWLELGVGVTTSPYITALLSLVMIVLATVSLALYKNKAFCHYICPVGRTVGFYSQLAPIELRAIDQSICKNCTTLECYNGNEDIEPCPTQLLMPNLTQNTYCTSCGNCVKSCPTQNISWQLRPQSSEAVKNARPHWDEAWFMLGLLALTSFHGLTMMPFWEQWMSYFGQLIGDSGQLLTTFSLGLLIILLIPASIYVILIFVLWFVNNQKINPKELFTGFVFVTIPLAFSYHIAHNLNHLVREGGGLYALLLNPLGIDTLPLTMMEKHQRHFDMLISQDVLFAIQGFLMLFGFWIAMKVIRYRAINLLPNAGWRLFPLVAFIVGINSFHLWLMMQPMVMRM